jgi:hypothetical protein
MIRMPLWFLRAKPAKQRIYLYLFISAQILTEFCSENKNLRTVANYIRDKGDERASNKIITTPFGFGCMSGNK